MLSYSHRFHGLGSLKSVYKYGRVVKGQLLSLRFNKNPRRQSYRCAVIVSRKVHGSAVVRNRIRRRVYETVRAFGLKINGPYDLIFTIYDARLANIEPAKLRDQIEELFIKAQIFTQGKASRDIIEPKET